MSCKAYRSAYVYRIGPKKNERSSNMKKPTWNFDQVRRHIMIAHSENEEFGHSFDSSNEVEHENVEDIDQRFHSSNEEEHQPNTDLTHNLLIQEGTHTNKYMSNVML